MTHGRFNETVIEFPDLGKQLRRIQGGVPWGWILGLLVLLILVFNTFYVIEPEEVGVVLRFGRFIGPPTQPGLHAKIPLVEQVFKVPVQRQLKEEFGFRTAEPGVRTRYSEADFSKESLMITGDLNLADVEWSVQYRIEDPEKFLFRVRNVRSTFRDMSESVMREVVGDRTINEVVTFGRVELAGVVQKDLQELCNQYQTGIHVDRVVLQNVFPPDPVRPSFNEVNQAEQEKDQKIKAAQEEYNKVVPRARGEAEQKIRQAEGYALDRVNRARGDAARFTSLYEAYRKAPSVTRKRMYLETLGTILPRAGRKVVVDEDVSGLLPLLNLDGAVAGAGPRRPAPGGEGGQP
jgi:membrane protease subunit HflK